MTSAHAGVPLKVYSRLEGLILLSCKQCCDGMMDRVRSGLTAFRLDPSGATSIEYALIATFISIMVVGWATFVGQSVSGFFMSVANGF